MACTIQTKMDPLYMWRCPAKSGPVFGSVLVILLAFQYFSLISVVAYSGLFLLTSVAAIKCYVFVMNTFLKKDIVSPLDQFADLDTSISSEVATKVASKLTDRLNCASESLVRYILIDNIVDSIKFGGAMYLATYIGSWFNMTTVLILFWTALFTVPKLYANNRGLVDPLMEKVIKQINDIKSKVTSTTKAKVAAKTEAESESESAISSSSPADLLGSAEDKKDE